MLLGTTGSRCCLVALLTVGAIAPSALASIRADSPPPTTATAPATTTPDTATTPAATPAPDKAPPQPPPPKKNAQKPETTTTAPVRPAVSPVVTQAPAAPAQVPAAPQLPAAPSAHAQQAAKAAAVAAAKAKARAKAKALARTKALARARAAERARVAALASVRHFPREPFAVSVVPPPPPVRTFASSGGVRNDLGAVALALAAIAGLLLALAVVAPPAVRVVAGTHPEVASALYGHRTEITVAAVSLLAGVTILAALSRWVI